MTDPTETLRALQARLAQVEAERDAARGEQAEMGKSLAALRAQLAEAQKVKDVLQQAADAVALRNDEIESQLAAMGRVVEAAKPYRERGCIHVSPWIRECSLCALVLRDALSALRETERKAQP